MPPFVRSNFRIAVPSFSFFLYPFSFRTPTLNWFQC